MKPSLYRSITYKTKQNNFYDGNLRMSELNQIKDNITIYDVYREQKEAAITYHNTRISQKFLAGLNYDLQNSVTNIANAALQSVELSLTNQLNKDLDSMIQSYSLEKNKVLSTTEPIAQQQLIQQLAHNAANLYTIILSHIGTNAVRGILNSSTLFASIKTCEKYISELKMANTIQTLNSNFYRIYYTLQQTRGYLQEEEAVGNLSEHFPTDFRFVNIGDLYVGGQLAPGGADIAGFSKDIMEQIQVSWKQAPIGQGTVKQKHQGSLREFLETMEYYRSTESFYLDEDTYSTIMKHAVFAAQSKATGTFTKNIEFRSNVNLFAKTKQHISELQGDGRKRKSIGTVDSISFKLKQYQSEYSRALEKMRSLYQLSALENKGKSNYLQASKQYRMLLNLQLSKMLSWIMQHNDLIITPQFGLISLADLFRKNVNSYFFYGPRSSQGLTRLDITKLEQEKRSIFLHIANS